MSAPATDDLSNRLIHLLGADAVMGADDDIERYVHEPRGRYRGQPLAVVRPGSTQEVAAVVALCRDAGVAIVPQGGNTGLVGGAAAGLGRRELIVSLERMRAVRELDPEGATMVVEAGCPLARVREAAAGAGLMFPLHLASSGTATIGGNIATNAGGHMTVRYGNTRRQVLGLEVVLADGSIYNGLTALRKDNSGYDLNQLFIGSEGTLGIVTAASLALVPAPRQSLTTLVGLAELTDALALLRLLRNRLGETLSAFELMPRLAMDYVLADLPDVHDPFGQPHAWYVFAQADSAVAGDWLREACLAALELADLEGLTRDVIVAGGDAQAERLWQLRDAVPRAQKRGGVSLKHDISVPVAAIPAFIEQATAALAEAVPGIRPCVFGHVGDGNLHFNLSQPEHMGADAFRATEPECNRIVFDLVQKHHGSIAAEHGIGRLRRDELARRADPVKLKLLGRLKQCLDPDALFNPGKVVDQHHDS
ncbi:FAD-binding oxidoreductase [Wenzhouxiangella sp. AB-CW3]|uniref:FAD-binding oxidoreductase n=1 Tax=Wenzhouxiangella sp. AB-CW3 TaxID=2771012 RepID=UPI00168ADFE7|nr:FAD-binding oxidoreductase [Wenzhouxiangella sp. AB-CW3]QOC22483.1 FAD-binding oxidoreductase [Wenzhouxiangella sp. AB-CW3]